MKSGNRFSKAVILGLLVLQGTSTNCSLKKKALVYGGIAATVGAALFVGVSFYRNYKMDKDCRGMIHSFGGYNLDNYLSKSSEEIKRIYLNQEIKKDGPLSGSLSYKLMEFNFFKIIGENDFDPLYLIEKVFNGKQLVEEFANYDFYSRKFYERLIKMHTKYLINRFDHNHVMARLKVINLRVNLCGYKKDEAKENTKKFLDRLSNFKNKNNNVFFDEGRFKKYRDYAKEVCEGRF